MTAPIWLDNGQRPGLLVCHVCGVPAYGRIARVGPACAAHLEGIPEADIGYLDPWAGGECSRCTMPAWGCDCWDHGRTPPTPTTYEDVPW